jgi:hypothetical protein
LEIDNLTGLPQGFHGAINHELIEHKIQVQMLDYCAGKQARRRAPDDLRLIGGQHAHTDILVAV